LIRDRIRGGDVPESTKDRQWRRCSGYFRWTLRAELIAAHGVLTLENVAAVTPMCGRATMRHVDGTERHFELELSPLVPPQLQLYELAAE
jgi:hypothetical protein